MKKSWFIICLCLLVSLIPASLSAESFADSAFESVWQRTDKPVEADPWGQVCPRCSKVLADMNK